MNPRISAAIGALALAALMSSCSDAATRIAYDIESGVAAFARSSAAQTTIRHVPHAFPEGCAGRYRVQLSANSALVVWCRGAMDHDDSGSSSHITTYHLRFVEVPRKFVVDKAAGEVTFIDLEKREGKAVVTALR